MNYPTVKQLKYFVALVENNHFGKAAEKCFVSQSAFSVAIKELENTLNAHLVDRTNKSVTVTNLGRETYTQAKLILHELSNLVEISRDDKTPLSGKLSLGIIPSIAPFILTKFVSNLNRKYQNLELYLHEGMTLDIYERLIKGDLDVLLMALPYDLKNTESLSLFKDKFHLVYIHNSKWISGEKKSKTPSDESILLLEDGHCMRDHALSACKLKNNKISRYTASSLLTLVEMVKSDIGITYLPEISLDSNLIEQSHLVIEAADSNSYREIGLVWRKGSSRSEEFKLLGEFIREQNH